MCRVGSDEDVRERRSGAVPVQAPRILSSDRAVHPLHHLSAYGYPPKRLGVCSSAVLQLDGVLAITHASFGIPLLHGVFAKLLQHIRVAAPVHYIVRNNLIQHTYVLLRKIKPSPSYVERHW